MTTNPQAGSGLDAFLNANPEVVVVEVVRTRGSVPREAGAYMLVSLSSTCGTIGGGQLEYMAIDKARQMLATGSDSEEAVLDIPLGPEIGQCCGGRVKLSIRRVTRAVGLDLLQKAEAEAGAMPCVHVFGGGHVGQSLAKALGLLPVRTMVVETRREALEDMPQGVETRLTPMPEDVVRKAPAGSAFVVLTHDHALDFLIAAQALKRGDAAYVGMIGSKTKKATFRNWFLRSGGGSEAQFSRLVSPIGGGAVRDKRPAVIAALAAAEILTALAVPHRASASAERH